MWVYPAVSPGCLFVMVDAATSLTQLIQKLLIYRGNRDVICRVFPPGPTKRAYTIILEKERHREQFFLDSKKVGQFARTGMELYVLTEIRVAFRNLDKLNRRKSSR